MELSRQRYVSHQEMSKEIVNQKEEINTIQAHLNQLEELQDLFHVKMDEGDARLERIANRLDNLAVIREQKRDERDVKDVKNNKMFNEIMKKLNVVVLDSKSEQEKPESSSFRGTHNLRGQERDYKKIKNELPKYDGKTHRGAIIWV